MINVNFNLASMSGIVLAVAGTALYALRSWRPELSRDHDIFFSAVSLLCGGILLFYGWRFDPIMQFGQVLLTGATIFFAVENIGLRKVSTEQAKRNTPIVDEERPISREYRVYQQAELDDLDVLVPEDEELPPRRRIRGTQDKDNRTSRNGYDTQIRRRPSSGRSSSSADRYQDDPPPRKRRPRPETPSVTDDWTTPNTEEELRPRRTRPRPSTEERRPSETTSSRPNRRPPLDDDNSESFRPSKDKDKDVEATPKGDYVDYQPIDPREEEDNSSNFDY